MSTTTGASLASADQAEFTPPSPSTRKPNSRVRYVELGSEQLQNWLDGQSTDRRAARDLLVKAFRDSPDQAELYSQGPDAPRTEFDALLYQSIAPGSRFILAYESSGPVSTHISHVTSDGNDTQARDAQESATYGSSLTGVKSKSKLVGIACSTLNLTTVLDNESNIPEPLRAARAEFDGFTGSTNTQVSSWYDPRTIYKYCRDLYHHDRPARSSRYISAVAVDSSYQGCGVGRSMLDRLAGGDQAPSGMSLHAESHMVPYYQKLGYRVSSETPYNPQGNPDDLASTSYFMHRPDPRTGSTAASLVAYANSAWDWMSCQSSRMAGQCGWSAISETASRIIRAGPWAKSHSD